MDSTLGNVTNPDRGTVRLIKSLPYENLSPLEAFRRLADQSHRVLLESSATSEGQGRYSFLGASPFLILQSWGKSASLTWEDRTELVREDPFAVTRRILDRFYALKPGLDLPFLGGAMGLFAYDLVRLIERLPETGTPSEEEPDLYLMFFDTVLAWDHLLKKAWIVHTPFSSLPGRRNSYERILDKVHQNPTSERANANISIGEPRSNVGRAGYIDRVLRCKSYIGAGDIFQANISHKFTVDLRGLTSETLYETLRLINPSPYGGACVTPEFSILSTSPERLISLRDGTVQTRPIAGTRPRGPRPDENQRWTRELLSSPKECAEHLMLVDLERNDLGRVCRYGSIEVDQWMTTEAYSHVVHIVSNLRGQLKPDLDAVDVLKAVFPGGTITGVPKVRCMEIIQELEPERRWAYTGSLGYIGFSGEMDLNILIRTLLVRDGTGSFQVGAGIVADSDPQSEYEETLHKARSFFEALRRLRSRYETPVIKTEPPPRILDGVRTTRPLR